MLLLNDITTKGKYFKFCNFVFDRLSLQVMYGQNVRYKIFISQQWDHTFSLQGEVEVNCDEQPERSAHIYERT